MVAVLLVSCTVSAAVVAQTVPVSREQIRLSYAPLVKQAAPAVVNIFATRQVQQSRGPTLFDDPLFNRLFGDFPFGGFTRERIENSLGSGVIVDAGGLIVTNNHVIDKAQEIKVVLSDRREFDARIVLADTRTDIAILEVEAEGLNLPYLALGDSDSLEVGDLVVAIGNPFGIGQTVTSGIVSALARTSIGISDFRSFIQTDAAINPGNSGGALVAMDGRLVGVNTAIFSKTGGSLGLGFAVPSNMVRSVLESAVSGKPLIRPWLSFTGKPVTPEIASALGLDRPVGVLVERIHQNGPAENAGVKVGDVVVAVGDHEVDDVQALRFRIATRPIGDSVDLRVVRRGTPRTIRFSLVAPPEDPPRNLTLLRGRNPFAGATVGNLSPALGAELGAEDLVEGVVLLGIQRGSTAERLGLRPQDIIREVNGRRIDRVMDIESIVAQPQERWRVVLTRGDRTLQFEVAG
ncbi:MAG: Do family serine endopeptidase [Alphaproteobacteria bacterium]